MGNPLFGKSQKYFETDASISGFIPLHGSEIAYFWPDNYLSFQLTINFPF
jgi:hypothetical protein